MPHQSFGAVRAHLEQREPITFDFGLYSEDTFVVVPEPSLGDTFDLADAPEPDPANMLDSARIIARFIRRMLAPEDRARFDAALYRIPAHRADIIVEAGAYVAGQVAGFPSEPPSSSSAGRRTPGPTSRTRPGGTGRSKR